MVNLLVNDVTITELPVKLHIKLESSGITIESIPTQAVAPMFLGGGEARVLTGDDFAQYLNLNNLNFKGFSKEAYIKNGQLPAGLWKFSVSVRHFYTNKTISNIGTVTAWITSYKPPVLTSPKDGENAPSNAALPLTFSWQASKHTGGTAAIMYRFEMWERRIEGVPAQTVAASVPPIYTTETAGRYVEIMPATLALEPGMKYCWRVTAFDPSGMVTVENKGESEVRTFQYLEKCPEVCGLTVDIKDDTGYASWEENRMHLGGYNFEFYDDEGTCHKTLWGSSTKTAGIGGEYGKTWHVRVQGLCRSGVEGPWSDWVDFKIPDAFKPLKDENGNTYGCGREVPERVITNFELIDNIQKGDTLEDERGTTKYIVHSAIKNEDGSFRGLSYMKLSFWGVKVLGEYNNMKVNTDGVIIGRYAWQSVKSDLLVADPEDIEKWADELALEMAGATYNNTIKDTIVLKYSRGIVPFETIAREGTKYYAVTSDGHKEEITSFINGQKRVMVKDGDGHELVIDKDGNVMGVEEYKKCGGSKALLRENIKEKDSQVTKSGNVKFFGTGDYLFDTYDNYSGKTGYAERFPSIGEGDYRPAYACVESNSKLEIKAAPYANITFKNERGVPVLCKDGILEVTARGDRDTTSIYAYNAENHIVGKVNILSYDKQTRKICLVPIGDTKAPDASAVKQELDAIFAKLMVDFDVTIGEPIAIQYAKDNIFTHGGSGMIGVYNTDQKAAINKLKERGIDNETVYLFFVNDCKALKANDSPDVVNGYMPRGYQFGFIYNELNNYRTIAHEICHGAFHLKHTFDATDYLAPEKATDNLMDYNHGEVLNHWQWKDIHQTKSVRFKWLQDEEGAENQIADDFLCTMKFINGFCYAYNNKIRFKYQSDGFPYLGHSCVVSDNIWGTIRINIKVKKDIDIIPQSNQLSEYVDYFEFECDNKMVSKERLFKDLIANYSKREKLYLSNLGNADISKELLQKWMTILPEQAYYKIDISTRIQLLKLLSNMILTEDYCSCDNMEEAAINLIKYTPQVESAQLLDELLYSDIYQKLCGHIDGDNYLKFLAELTKKWAILHIADLEELSDNYQKAQNLYYWNRVNSTQITNRYITYKTSYEKGSIEVEFWAGDWVDTWGRPWEIHKNQHDAQDIILLCCRTIPTCFFSDAKQNQTIIMPAFLFEAMCSKFDFDKKVDYFDTVLTIASFTIGIGELAAIAKTWEGASWAKKGWIIWQYATSSANMLLSNECVNSKVFNDFLRNYPQAKEYWEIISRLTSIASSGEKVLDCFTIIQISSGFHAFNVSWSAYKATLSVTNMSSEENNMIEEIDSLIASINSQLSN